MDLQHVTTRVSGPDGYLVGLGDVLARATATGGMRIYTASATGGGVLVLDPAADLGLADQAGFGAGAALDAPRSLTGAVLDGQAVLLATGRHGTTVEVFPLAADGQITTPHALQMTGPGVTAGAVLAAEAVTLGARTFLALASRHWDGVTVWELRPGNSLTRVAQPAGAGGFGSNDITALEQIVRNGQTHLLALSGVQNTLVLLRMAADGTLTPTGRVDLRDGLAIDAGSTLDVVTVAGQSYVLIGAAGSSSLSVVEIRADGGLALTDQVIDDLDTRFAGLCEVATLTVNGQVFVAVAGSDDGVSLLTLLPDGRLVHLATRADDTATALTNPQGLTLIARADGLDLAVAGGVPDASGSGVTLLRAVTGAIGVTVRLADSAQDYTGTAERDQIVGGRGTDRLWGGRGDDILVDGAGQDMLWGGAGADVFVLSPDGQPDRIMDFEPGRDRLDLADLGRFYSLDAIGFTPTATGASLQVGSDQVIVQTASGRPLVPSEIGIADLRDLSHLLIAPLALGAERQAGGPGPDRLEGRNNDDTLIGGGGADVLSGGGGHDWLIGGAEDPGRDALSGQVFRLYRATLDRAPDTAGLLDWVGKLETGARSLTQVADGFVGSREFRTAYPDPDPTAFVTLLYRNVLDRAPDAAGLASWTGLLASGRGAGPRW